MVSSLLAGVWLEPEWDWKMEQFGGTGGGSSGHRALLLALSNRPLHWEEAGECLVICVCLQGAATIFFMKREAKSFLKNDSFIIFLINLRKLYSLKML